MAKRRTRIAEGVYRDAWGLAATVKVGRVQREQRFPDGTELGLIQSWRTRTRAELDEEREDEPRPVRGTVRQEAARYLERHGTRDACHLRAWFQRFGDVLLYQIRKAAVQDQVDTWKGSNVAARTIRHRLRLLRALYRTPPRALGRLRLPKNPPGRPIAVPLETIRNVAARLAASHAVKTRARFLIRAITGQRPAQIGRATPEDIDLGRRLWFVRSAKGGNPIPFPLNDEAVRAWQLFSAANAWGLFSTKKHAAKLRAMGWPKGLRPMALRSTLAIDLLLNGADLGDVQGLLGHTQIETTRRHYAPVLVARLQAVTSGRVLGVLPAEDCQPSSSKRVETRRKHRGSKRRTAALKRRRTA